MRSKRLLALLAAASLAPVAYAAEPMSNGAWDVGVRASTLGLGVEVRRSFDSAFAVRASFNGYGYDVNEEVDDVDYDGTLDLQSFGLVADWHPLDNGFRLSAGLYLNQTELEVDAEPSGGSFEFDGRTYSAAEIGRAEGTADFDTIAPYLGFGYSGALGSDSRLQLTLDVGVLFQGEPSFDLDVTCGSAVPALRCTQLQADVEDERKQFEDDTDSLSYYPVIAVGLSFRLGGR